MGLLVDGVWQDDVSRTKDGHFIRPTTKFRNWVTPDGSPGPSGKGDFTAEAGRYHLYVSLSCPWAHRTIIFRKLKALENVLSMSVVSLEELEQVLSQHRYLVGNTITEADWRLFCTLIRFDAVYYSHFKCNWRHIYEYPNLSNYLRDLYQVPGVAETVSIEQIKRHYYGSQRHVNPTGIVPVGPQLDFAAPHDRARFGA